MMRLSSYYDRVARRCCVIVIGLCMLALVMAPRVWAASDDPLQEALEQWSAGQEVEGAIPVTVEPTTYNPLLGGVNCNGDCTRLGASHSGLLVENWWDRAAACPPEIPRNSQLTFIPRWHTKPMTVWCLDQGSAIQTLEDGTLRIDVLTQDMNIWRAPYPALLLLPKPEQPIGGGPEYAPICLDAACVTPVIVPDLQPPAPSLVCPATLCEGTLVKDMTNGHFGVDWRTWSVYAPAAGQVIKAEDSLDGCGGSVVLDLGGGWWSRLCHFERIFVKAGQTVNTGQLLGFAGQSGNSDGEHVHAEIYWGWTPYSLEVLQGEEQP